jgi:hypothetical protein
MASKTLLGEWQGGIWSGGSFKLQASGNGFVKGEFRNEDGSEVASIQGQLQEEGTSLKGLYHMPGAQASDAAGFQLVLDASGTSASGTAMKAGGAAQQCVYSSACLHFFPLTPPPSHPTDCMA